MGSEQQLVYSDPGPGSFKSDSEKGGCVAGLEDKELSMSSHCYLLYSLAGKFRRSLKILEMRAIRRAK